MTRTARRSNTGFLGLIFGRHANLVKQVKPLFMVCLIGFTFSMITGWYLGESMGDLLSDELADILPDLAELDAVGLFLFILFNNALKNLMWMLLGIIGAIPSLYFSFINGFIIGNVAYSFSEQTNTSVMLAGLLPHGIIEIPTLILCSAIGMALGYSFINRLRGKKGNHLEVKMALSLYIRRIFPLVVIAAIIEVTITPIFMAIFALTL